MDLSGSSDLRRLVGSLHRSSSASSESPVISPNNSSGALHVSQHIDFNKPVLVKTDSTEEASGSGGKSVYFAVGDTMGDDDDADYIGEDGMDLRGLSKRDIHTLNEQKRRDIIKQGYSQLSEIVPTCRPSPTGAKVSRATMLQKTIDYIIFLQNQQVKQQEQLEKLQREVKALKIMKENYEQIARAHQHTPTPDAPQVPDHVKFLVFQSIADQLFQSFNSSISVTSFDTLSSCIISWLEEYCKPQSLRELVIGNLQRVNALSSNMDYPMPPPVNQLPNPPPQQLS